MQTLPIGLAWAVSRSWHAKILTEIKPPSKIVDTDFRELCYNKTTHPIGCSRCCSTARPPTKRIDFRIIDPGNLVTVRIEQGGLVLGPYLCITRSIENIIQEEHGSRGGAQLAGVNAGERRQS
jgi:hypothetical protein